MYHSIGQNMLISFIMRYYSFKKDMNLLKMGQILVYKTLQYLIHSNRKYSTLKKQQIPQIAKQIFINFDYKLGGLNKCYEAFGNFLITEIKDFHKLQWLKQSKFKEKVLIVEDYRIVLDLLKDHLERMSYIFELNKELPYVKEQTAQTEKIMFLKQIFEEDKRQQNLSKKKRVKQKVDKKHNYSVIVPKRPRKNQMSKIEQQTKTEVDTLSLEFQEQIKLKFQQKNNVGTCTQHFTFELNEIKGEEQRDDLILNFDEFFMTDNQSHRQKVIKIRKQGGKKGRIRTKK